MRDMNLTTPSLLPQSSSSANWYFAVAIPVPMRQLFDYLVPASLVPTVAAAPLDFIGRRAQLKFGNRELIGIITSCHQQPSINPDKIRAIDSLLDPKPITDQRSHSHLFLGRQLLPSAPRPKSCKAVFRNNCGRES